MTQEKVRTLDGERTRVDELNTGAVPDNQQTGILGRLKRFNRNLSLVMAGMYTGLNCYGTPKTEHEYGEGEGDKPQPDRRLI